MTPREMTYRAHARATLMLGLPLIGSHLLQFSIHLTDMLMLGWYDIEALAAVTLAGSFWFLLFIMGSGFAFAVAPMVASAQSSGRSHEVRRITRMGMWISLIYGVTVLPLMYFSATILIALGQETEIAQLAQEYLRITCWGTLPALLVMVLKNYLAALERANIVLWITLAAFVMNVVVNYALIFGNLGAPELGMRGAAIASLLMQTISFVILAIFIARALPQHALFQRFWRSDREAFGAVFRLGWPIGLTNLSESGLFTASAILVGWIGTAELAAHGIALQLTALTFMIQVGFSNTATVRAGTAFGRNDAQALKRGALVLLVMAFVVSILVVIIFLSIPELLIGLFLNPADPARGQIIAIGVSLLSVAALFQFADSAQVNALGLLRGVQDTKVPMLLAAVAYWPLGMGSSYLFGFVFEMGAVGVWLGLVVGLAVAGALMMHRFWTKAVRI
ncbi:MAG TPA: MATE family efflux transporter [Rhodobacteraceae bacterium]|jgi:MATE family multidrug resistance protein|nr:MATE family efflux transporter [Paracoccaceae bacterium]